MVPPPGPATPVVDIPILALSPLATPSAISIAVCSLTAPNSSKVSLFTPNLFILESLEYVTQPSRNTEDIPG